MSKLDLVATVLLWAVALRRLGSLREPGPPRSIELALIFLAFAEPFTLEPVYRLANQLLATPAGGSMVRLALATGTMAGVLSVSEGAQARRQRLHRGWAVAVAAVAVTTLPLVASPVRTVPPELTGTTHYFDAGWRSVVLWVPFLAFTCWAASSALLVSWPGARKAAPGPLRTSLRLVVVTCLLGWAYVVTKSVVLLAWHMPGADLRFWARFDQVSEPVIVSAACVLGALGVGWQSISPAGQVVRKRALLWQLQPLWSVLHELAPGVELIYGKADVDFRLRRRVLEMKDALLEVEDRLAADLVQAAHSGAESAEAPAALAVAAVLRYLADKGGWSSLRPGTGGAQLPSSSASTFDEELAWLKEVSKCYRDPRAKSLSARLAASSA